MVKEFVIASEGFDNPVDNTLHSLKMQKRIFEKKLRKIESEIEYFEELKKNGQKQL